MIRKGFKMKLYPGFEEEYEKRHNQLWPEMREMIHEYGGHNYSIFLDRETLTRCSAIWRSRMRKSGTRPRKRPSAGNGGTIWRISWRPTPTTARSASICSRCFIWIKQTPKTGSPRFFRARRSRLSCHMFVMEFVEEAKSTRSPADARGKTSKTHIAAPGSACRVSRYTEAAEGWRGKPQNS